MNPMRVGGDADPATEPGNPLHILPEEMWLEILEYLKEDPRDVLNLGGTCAQFGDMVGREVDLASCQLEEVIPLVLRWLPKADVLSCSGICNRVRKSVDKVLDNLQLIRPQHAPLFPRLVPPKKDPREYEQRHFALQMFWDDYRLIDSVEAMEELQRMIEWKEVSTVVTKKLSFQFTWDENNPSTLTPPDFLDRMLALLNLDMVREKTHHLCLFGDEEADPDPDPEWTYDLIRRCVAALPNLRRLYCTDLPEIWFGRELGRYIANGHPLPVAPLESFTINWKSRMPVPLFQEVARRYSGTLTELYLYLHESEINDFDWEEDYHFPALVKLELHHVSWPWQPVLARMHAPQLEELSWEIYGPAVPFPVSLLFRNLLEKFSLLSKLTLEISSGGVVDRFGALEEFRDQRHGHVKHLKLEGHWYNIPLPFLAGFFPNLESISVQRQYIDEQRDNPDPDVVQCRQIQMERSGLWNQLPKLRRFSCGVHLRTRADAEAFQNRPASSNQRFGFRWPFIFQLLIRFIGFAL